MDAVITDLPASAQRVLAGHLKSCDAGNARLASRQLSGVSSDRSNIWVVASTFQDQIEGDAGAGTSGGSWDLGWGTASSSQAAQDTADSVHGGLCTAASLARAAQGATHGEVLIDASRSYGEAVWQALFSALLSSPTLSELTVTEFSADDNADVLRVLAHRQISATSAFSWSMAQEHRCANATTLSGGTPSRYTPEFPAAAECAWLPALVSAASRRVQLPGGTAPGTLPPPQQQQEACKQEGRRQQPELAPLSLKLQLLAPLLPQHCMQLLQLTDTVSLAVVDTPAWLLPGLQDGDGAGAGLMPEIAHPVAPTGMLRELRALPHLSSLQCTVGQPMQYKETPAEVGMMLQQLLLDLGPQLTQLTLGTPSEQLARQRVHYSLSAPLRMPALRSLTCSLGFSLDVETDADDIALQQMQLAAQPTAAAARRSSDDGRDTSSSRDAGVEDRAPAGPAALLPSLTRLVLIDPACVPDVLQCLGESAAACSQLQHLEIPQLEYDDGPHVPDYNAYLDQQQPRQDPAVSSLQQLGKLRGLRQLQAVVCGQRQADVLVAELGSQLQGLTVTCQRSNPLYLPMGMPSSASQVKLQALCEGMPHLTSLKVVGSTGAVLDPSIDLPAAAMHLTALRSLSYTGGIFALPSRGFELLPGMLPSSLQGLTLVVRQGASLPFDADGSYTLSPGCFPQGLTSLKCRGFCWERPGEVEPWSPWFGWEFLPAGLRQLELDAEAPCLGVGPGSILPVSSPAAVAGVSAQELSGVAGASAATAAAAVAAACGSTFESPPSLVELPALESLALYMRANRHAADMDEPDRLPLAALLQHLSGLTNLTNLHISSQCKYSPSDWGSGLSSLVALRVLTLDVALPDPGKTYTGRQLLPDPLNIEAFDTLVSDLSTNLANASGMRLLRLPQLRRAARAQVRSLEQRLPNCLLVEADDTFLQGKSCSSSSVV